MAQVDTLLGTRRQTLKATWGMLSKPWEAVSSPREAYDFARAVSERFEEKGRTQSKYAVRANFLNSSKNETDLSRMQASRRQSDIAFSK